MAFVRADFEVPALRGAHFRGISRGNHAAVWKIRSPAVLKEPA
jgi:hypothetical protein